MAYVVALTGGIGSGKTAVSDLLHDLGAAVVDTDRIAHELTATGGAAIAPIAAHFGAEVIARDGSLNRATMRERVFADPTVRRELEAILHPLIRKRAVELVQAAMAAYVVLVVPLLVETGAYRDIANRILVVDCPEEVQIERTMKRSQLERAEVERILASQATRAARLAVADDVIVNDQDRGALGNLVAQLHCRYLGLARGHHAGSACAD